MKLNRNLLFIALLFIYTGNNLFATNYYLSANGNNTASGKSPGKAWKTIDQLNKVMLKPGDTVFFHAAHHFTGSIEVSYSGTVNRPIVFCSYGKGDKPVISGAVKLKEFSKYNTELVTTDLGHPVQHLYKDDKLMFIARFPDDTFLKMDGGDFSYLIDKELDMEPEIISNSTIRLRTINWCYFTREITEVEGNKLFFNDSIRYSCDPGYGYYLEGKMEYLTNENEWFFNPDENKIYLTGTGYNEYSEFEASYIGNGVSVAPGVSHVVFSGLHFDKFAKNGFYAEGNNNNIIIQDCLFTGCIERAIFFMTGSWGCRVENNEITDVPGQGIFLFESNNCTIENNIVHRIGLIPGYGLSGVNGATGILITANETRKPGNPFRPHDNLIIKNRVDSTGYNGIRMDGYNSRCEFNVVKNVMLTLNDGGIIYCWGADSTFTHHNVISNNVLLKSYGNVEGTPGGEPMCNGLYIDNKVHHILAENNTISGAHNGIVLNDNTNNIVMRGNTSYGNQNGIIISEWWEANKTRDNIISNNIFCATDYRKHTLSISSVAVPDFNPGVIDSNTYVSLFERFHLRSVSLQKGEIKRTDECSYEGWTLLTGQDKHSRAIINPGSKNLNTELLVNEKKVPVTLTLPDEKSYTDLEGVPVSGEIILPPLSSRILIYKTNE